MNAKETARYLRYLATTKTRLQKKSLTLLSNQVKKYPDIVYSPRMTPNGLYNLGDITETLVCYMLSIESEDNQHEIKSFILNSWHILTSLEREQVYILNTYGKKTGLYKCSADKIYKRRITNREQLENLLQECDLVTKIG